MAESEDMKIIVHAFDEAQRLLRAHVELSADAKVTVERMDDLLRGQQILEALERTRLRSLRHNLVAQKGSSTLT